MEKRLLETRRSMLSTICVTNFIPRHLCSCMGSYIMVLIHSPIYQLSFARAGDSKWTWLPPSADYEDCIYMDGLLYAVTSTGGIDAFDLNGPTILRKVVMEDTKDYICEHLYMA
uniref:KIB1-4 beta-propeller domain-containing protein n=1 Tax=Arundo donax TaxID=35708 RepID=A0A0A9G1N0_ARUDO